MEGALGIELVRVCVHSHLLWVPKPNALPILYDLKQTKILCHSKYFGHQ